MIVATLLSVCFWVTCANVADQPTSGPYAAAVRELRALIAAARYGEVEARARKLLVDIERAHGQESRETADALDVLVEVLWRLDKAAQPDTAVLAERVVAIRERTLGRDHASLASSLLNLAIVRMRRGEYAPARPLFERALAIRENALGPDHPDVAPILNALGLLLQQTREYDLARPLLERALGIWQRAFGPEHRSVALVINNLALLSVVSGDYVAARPLFERVVAIMDKVLPSTDPLLAAAHENLGNVTRDTGDAETAVKSHRRALALAERALGPDAPTTARILSSLAGDYAVLGDFARARALYARALAVRQKALGADHPEVAIDLTAFARLLTRMADYETARPMFERALAINEKALGPDHPPVGEVLRFYADLLARRREYGKAKEHYERAIAIHGQTFGADLPMTIRMRIELSEMLVASGSPQEAITTGIDAEGSRRRYLSIALGTLPERQALLYVSELGSARDALVSALVRGAGSQSADDRANVFDSIIRSRALVLDALASRHQTVSRMDDLETRKLREEWTRARGRLARLLVRAGADVPVRPDAPTLTRARDDSDRAEQALAARSSSFRQAQERAQVGLAEVAAAVPGDAALVSFVRYADVAASSAPAAKPVGAEGTAAYVAFVVKAGDAVPALVPLGRAADLERRIARWRRAITAPQRVARDTEPDYRRTAQALRHQIWDPIAAHLTGIERVFIVPDGLLHLVDWATLPSGNREYLVERDLVMHYLSAERDLAGTAATASGQGLLALGDPAYDAVETPGTQQRRSRAVIRDLEPPCAQLRRRFMPLPASGREAAEIAALWSAAAGQDDPLVLRGGDATETAFKSLAPTRRVLHLATHGFFLRGDCPATNNNPLLLSGLVFSGANRRPPTVSVADDGILTAEEVGALDLAGVEWAVLSACDTALGELRVGEGVLGLRRAFQVAGARTVIMSLWAVDDDTSRRWMTTLYRARYTRNASTADAVRAANLELLATRRRAGRSTHPLYWSGFIAAGDWR